MLQDILYSLNVANTACIETSGLTVLVQAERAVLTHVTCLGGTSNAHPCCLLRRNEQCSPTLLAQAERAVVTHME